MLEGVKVVEMASIAAGPVAAAMLAEWGADVIKIEPLAGDPGRHTMAGLGVSDLKVDGGFELHNRGKRSIALQLSTPEAREIAHKLLKDADIFVTNMLPNRLRDHGLDWPDLRVVNPKLVYANITGYGREGADKDLRGIDHAAFWSRSGMVHLMTPKGMDPIPIRMAMGDRITAMALVSGILAAYIDALRTGKGKLVDTSLLRVGAFAVGTDMALQLTRGRVGSHKPRHENVNPYHGFYPTKDGRWMAVNFGRATNLPAQLGHPELVEDQRLADVTTRREHNAEIVDLLDSIFRERTMDEWCTRFREVADFVWAPVQNAKEVTEDPQVEAAGAFVEVPFKDGSGTFRSPAMPVGFFNNDGTPDGIPHSQGPILGEHADEILHSVGYDSAAIKELREAHIIL